MKLTDRIADFINKAKVIHTNKYDYSDILYKNKYKKISIICPVHGRFNQSPQTHVLGHGCPACGQELKRNNFIKNMEKSIKNFIDKSNIIHKNKYNYSKVTYINGTKVPIFCMIHQEYFLMKPTLHIRGHGCPRCAGVHKRTNAEFIIDANKIHNNFYDYSTTNYINRRTDVKISCPKHGAFLQNPHVHLRGHGCLVCKKSKGELEIFNFLNARGIKCKPEHKFADCLGLNGGKLRFDFFLPDLKTCIEFDGRQHFQANNFFGKASYLNTKEHDKIKTTYCKNNDIKLIRIKYDKNIKATLNKKLKIILNTLRLNLHYS